MRQPRIAVSGIHRRTEEFYAHALSETEQDAFPRTFSNQAPRSRLGRVEPNSSVHQGGVYVLNRHRDRKRSVVAGPVLNRYRRERVRSVQGQTETMPMSR
jgi:hypothetical protein